jgi:predicted nucleic acid-binding Zn ribbon protein
MPKFPPLHKRAGSTGLTKSGPPRALGDLLARATPVLSQIRDQKTRQNYWQSWLTQQLPSELSAHLTGAVERDGALTVFADSAAWAARLRYALTELKADIDRSERPVGTVAVRVLPRR